MKGPHQKEYIINLIILREAIEALIQYVAQPAEGDFIHCNTLILTTWSKDNDLLHW